MIFANLDICRNDISYLSRFMSFYFNIPEYDCNSMRLIHGIFNEMNREIKEEMNKMKQYFEEKLNQQKLRDNEQKQIIYANMSSITIPPEITNISNGLFQNCAQLRQE